MIYTMNIEQFSRWLQLKPTEVREYLITRTLYPARNILSDKLTEKILGNNDKIDKRIIENTLSRLKKIRSGRQIISKLVRSCSDTNRVQDSKIIKNSKKITLYGKMATEFTGPEHLVIKIAALIRMRSYFKKIYDGKFLNECRKLLGTDLFDYVVNVNLPPNSIMTDLLPTHYALCDPALPKDIDTVNRIFAAERDYCWFAFVTNLKRYNTNDSTNVFKGIYDQFLLMLPKNVEPSFCAGDINDRINAIEQAYQLNISIEKNGISI